MAAFARRQADTVVENIVSLAAGNSELATYQSMGVAIAVPIGPRGGAGQFPGQDDIVGAEVISNVKGQHMGVEPFAELFGLATAATI